MGGSRGSLDVGLHAHTHTALASAKGGQPGALGPVRPRRLCEVVVVRPVQVAKQLRKLASPLVSTICAVS